MSAGASLDLIIIMTTAIQQDGNVYEVERVYFGQLRVRRGCPGGKRNVRKVVGLYMSCVIDMAAV